MLTQAAARKIASQKDNDTNKSAQSSTNETVSPPLENDQGHQDSDATSKPASSSQKPREPKWHANLRHKLNVVRKQYNDNWEQVGSEMNRQPGDCFRQTCLFDKNEYPWSREEDIRLLEMMDEGENDPEKIANILYPSKPWWRIDRVTNRMALLQSYQLHTLALYKGTSVNDDSSLAQITKNLNISDAEHVEKALEDAKSELDRQRERLQKINKDWCNKCAHSMVERDYEIYKMYYKHDDELKMAIVNGKIEPTFEIILPKVIDAYARSNDSCCYCGRKIKFTERSCTIEQSPTAASADHFSPKRMAFNSDTHLHLTCRQCNFAKSNATDAIFKSYLQDIKEFHSNSGTLSSKHIPLDDENNLQAWLTWKNHKENRRKKTSSSTSNTISQDANATGSTKEPVDKVPSKEEMDDEDILFMKMAAAMGLRDPMTGAIGVFDSTMKKSNRFDITFWDWGQNANANVKKMATGIDMEKFKKLKIQVNMTITSHAQQLTDGDKKILKKEAKEKIIKKPKAKLTKDENERIMKAYKELKDEAWKTIMKNFYNWLEVIKGASPGSQLN